MSLITMPEPDLRREGTAGGGALSVSDTYWGYEIRDRQDRFDRETVTEPFLKFLGLVCVLAAYGQWVLPGMLFGPEALVAKASLGLLMGLAGAWLYWFASRGFAMAIEIDLARCEVRVVRRNGRGRRRIEATIPMARIESAFVQRSKVRGRSAELFLRLRAPEGVLHVATGSERELETLLRRLSHDVRPIRERVDEKLARTLRFKSRRA